ncbi:hypothetical protein [Leptothoe sp. PORK10 BA2]|uniref:hypothetical protein n=1 Tax=Leptothoe sp. PORK10 BA2 TaxID=3110254 RepID=UPI002B20CB81|nr:hypothetical protein [Leptothoe sp. PORK10 BA2]MEA5463572.1 hypothetical protein [Leptothoe sp. PORK10 BA2]
MKAAIDNITLIQKFLKGEDSLLANRELRMEKALNETQLLTTQGILLAKGRLTDRLPNIVIRLKSDYWELLNQLTLDACFLPLHLQQDQLDGATFTQYDYHSVPAGYHAHCQEASAFWKTWWINHRKLQLMDMLLLCQKRWYPVQEMLCDTGTIYVKTWRGEKTLSISEMVIWLDRNTKEHRPPSKYPQHHQTKVGETAPRIPVRADLLSNQLPGTVSGQIMVPDNLRQVIKADNNRLLVHTVLGPVIIEGQNLTCALARKVVKAL